MYWPIGAPKVYALSKHATPRSAVTESHDGAESSEPSASSEAKESIDTGSESRESSQSRSTATNGEIASNGNDVIAREGSILDAKVSRGGAIFATITRSSLTIWQTKPTVALASVVRSSRSMKAYGLNTALLLRPDALVAVVQTSGGYMISYSLATDPSARVYATQFPTNSNRHARKDSIDGYSSYQRSNPAVADGGPAEGDGIKEVNVRFRMVIRIDAGINKSLALDNELIIATQRPAALQCINWITDKQRAQTSTELVSKMSWIVEKCSIIEMVHDRPMNLTCWITSDGRAYAVQRRSAANVDMDNPSSLFQGFCFRHPETTETAAGKAAINARFSLIAVGCANGGIDVYTVKDYMGNIPLSHKLTLSVSAASAGEPTFLSYSPDGYCLFAGYEKGWAMWSVFGKPLSNSFNADRSVSAANVEEWLLGVKSGFWTGGGCELVLQGLADDRLWVLDVARNALSGCYSPSSISRGLLQSSTGLMLYKGHDVPDLTAVPADMGLWQTIQIPASYLLSQWPIKSAVVSADAKYIAVAGRRGLAHYSTVSARWRTFDDPEAEQEFAVRGEELSAPAIFLTISSTDSLLVYTYDNTLLHFIIVSTASSVKLVQVGQIGFHGIIRAPPRVRAISWILPAAQLEHGDPSHDVATASVLFLVDGKLVLLQPSTNEMGELKYDMRVIAQNVEYYILLRDSPQHLPGGPGEAGFATTPGSALDLNNDLGHSLRDSLWFFDGTHMNVWPDVQDVLASAPADLGRDLPPTVRLPLDFFPIAPLVGKAILHGVDAELVQRRDVNFSLSRLGPRTSLFLPQLLRQHLADFNSPAALHLSHCYRHLPYLSHALEVLLHDILDNEVDNPPSPPEAALLPTALSFLSSFPSYLDVVVNCTRKTELRSWRTLFAQLPPVIELFEQAMREGRLKTAAGYLLVLHTLDEQQDGEKFQVAEFARLLRRAVGEEEWELGRELARFLVGIDASGGTLRKALEEAKLGENMEAGEQTADGVDREDFAGGQGRVSDYFSLRR
ncbi:WD40 repeat protein [Saxophila tyrrhenica]|uniref:WD40 repeat protein n=1 Tax=Saxophila tyrrhenica TaxID=1690608 RepID=A0AAV9P998_9PEZI|nr:WD40 repeat protein [Saxophila tyrrhenica]